MPPTSTLPSAADALTALNSYQMPDSGTVLSQAQQQYGVQGLQDRVNTYKTLTNNLTGAIAAVDPSVTGRTSGSLVTEGQRGALVNRERAPVIGQLSTANQGLTDAEAQYTNADNNAKQRAQMTITDNQNKYNHLKDTYDMANTREQQQAAAALEQQKMAEQQRQFNESQATARGSARYSGGGGAATNPAAGYSVKQLSSGNKAYTGPNGQTNLYQYAAAMAGGDPGQTYDIIKQQLASGSATDRGAANGIAKLEKQGLSQDQIIARLKASNGYIFN